MKVKICLIVFFVSCLSACIYDPPRPRVEIENQSGEKVIFDLYFDEENYKPSWSRGGFEIFLTYDYGYSYPGPKTELVSTDKSELVQRYSMPSKSTYVLSGWGDYNDMVLYRKIRIIKERDTLLYENIEAIKKSFKRIDKYCSRLVIK